MFGMCESVSKGSSKLVDRRAVVKSSCESSQYIGTRAQLDLRCVCIGVTRREVLMSGR